MADFIATSTLPFFHAAWSY